MASTEEFEFDVAFSFHSLDESLANELNDRLQDRFKTFLYSKKQEMLAGADGEEVFNSVFGKTARCVVVLCRKEWGETPFTRIEQTAIRNRAFEVGFDFTLFIPTDKPESIPQWLPKIRLWYGLERFGLDGAAAVVEARVEELGGAPRAESVLNRAARFQRARDLDEAKRHFRENEDGVRAAQKAYETLGSTLNAICERIRASNPKLVRLNYKLHQGYGILTGLGTCLVTNWSSRYSNSLDGSELSVILYDGVPRLPGLMSFEEPKHLKSLKFNYELFSVGQHGYIEKAPNPRRFVADKLADHLLRLYMDSAEQYQKKRS
jgi:hypothetical protein